MLENRSSSAAFHPIASVVLLDLERGRALRREGARLTNLGTVVQLVLVAGEVFVKLVFVAGEVLVELVLALILVELVLAQVVLVVILAEVVLNVLGVILLAVVLFRSIFGARVKRAEVRLGERVASGVGHGDPQLPAAASASGSRASFPAAVSPRPFSPGALPPLFFGAAFLAAPLGRPGREWRSATCFRGRLDSNCSQAPEITSNLRTVSVG